MSISWQNGAVEPEAKLMAQLSGADPFPVLQRLRAEQPVFPITMPTGGRIWFIIRYEDARRALTDPRLSNRMARGMIGGTGEGPIGQHLLSTDPPDHTRLRRLVSAGFTARRTERLEPRITEIVAGLLDQMAGQDEIDLIDAFAFPLPIQVICELLGVPSADRDEFRTWSNTVVVGNLAGDAEHEAQLRTAVGQIVGYIKQLLADKRVAPADDLLSALLNVREEGDQLSEEELLAMVFLMLIAGHETTMNLIGNGVYLLLTHPDQRERIAADRSLLPGAVEEFLRYEPPVQTTSPRVTSEPVEYSGVTIPANEMVMVSLLSANRDGVAFPDVDRFDIARRGAAHLTFGHGIHFCLGAALARLEGRIAIAGLLDRFPGLQLARPAHELDRRSTLFIRGLAHLRVRLKP
jgi:cytochrome P450